MYSGTGTVIDYGGKAVYSSSRIGVYCARHVLYCKLSILPGYNYTGRMTAMIPL